jgi:hypothetical protein
MRTVIILLLVADLVGICPESLAAMETRVGMHESSQRESVHLMK